MQFRVVRTKYKSGVRQYGQFVESFRRPSDGMPMHRVVASIGIVTDEEAANLKLAFGASRHGQRLHVLQADVAPVVPTVAWTRDLVDICAALQAFADCGLHQLLRDLFADHGEEVDPADVVAALVVQRCVAPDSKLAACRWFGDTVLPELLGITPAQFHNSRVHRVLDRLQSCEQDLQRALAGRLLAADALGCTAFFLDCTDTWFTGHGPAMARRGKTKEEFYRQKVGIVLLCRQDGMPLQFKLIQGNTDDGVAMLSMLRQLGSEPWLGGAPVVCDRAVGNTSDLLEFIDMDLQFVTALVRSEHAAYGVQVRCPALAEFDPKAPDCLEKAGAAVVQSGMTRHAADLYWLQRAAVQRGADDRTAVQAALGTVTRPQRRRGDDLALDMLTQARKYKDAVESGEVASYTALQRGLGRSNGHMYRFLSMLKLPVVIQEQIEQGIGAQLSKKAIVRICEGRDPQAHAQAFAVQCATAGDKRSAVCHPPQQPNDRNNPWVNLVVAFNPLMWRAKRLRADARIERINDLLARLNPKVAAGSLPAARAVAKVTAALNHYKLSRFYAAPTVQTIQGVPVLHVVRDNAKWQAARASDGYCVIAASPQHRQARARIGSTVPQQGSSRTRLQRNQERA